VEIRRTLTYPFADPRWPIKLGISMLLLIPPSFLASLGVLATWMGVQPDQIRFTTTPVWGILVSLLSVPALGYMMRIMRRVIVGSDVPLPSWDDAGGLLRDGLKLWAVVTIWSIPVIILGVVAGGPSILLLVAINLIVWMFRPAAEARLAATGSLTSALDFSAVVNVVRTRFSVYLRLIGVCMLGLLLWLAFCVAVPWAGCLLTGGSASVGAISAALTVGSTLFLVPYAHFVLYHLYGQVYAESAESPLLAFGAD
jgi:hypothetical protein